MYNELFESIIRTSGENTDDIDDFDDRDNFWAPVPENLLFEYVLREVGNQFNLNNLPIITIEINTAENYYFNKILASKTDDEKDNLIGKLKNYYTKIFKQYYTGKSEINDSSKINVKLVNSGIKHCLNQKDNYYLWPVIRYLQKAIKIAFHTTEPSQHLNDPNTTRGNITHIFYCKGDYILKSGKRETHILRITAITFKKSPHNNFRHITENNKIINTKLISIEIQ